MKTETDFQQPTGILKRDRRIRRTRRLLRTALLDLILEKGFDLVTVEDITQRADVSRATFYLHYKDKEDLLLENINEMIDDLFDQITHVPLSEWNFASPPEQPIAYPILLIFRHAAENADIYRIILRGAGAAKGTARLRKIISNLVSQFIQMKDADGSLRSQIQIPMDYFANYFTGALLGIVNWWLESGQPYRPDEMAAMYQQMFFKGALSVFSEPENPA